MNELGPRGPTGVEERELEAIAATFGVTGEAAARARRTEWAQTSLGPVRQWPAAMRTAVRLAMDSPQPVTLYLGDQMVIVQNDAVLAVNDRRARDASGRAAIQAYPELREYFEQLAARTRRGEAAQEPTVLIPRRIDGRMIDFWYHTAAAPIRDDGAMIGIYQVWLERTHEVLAARRLRVVNALSGQPAGRSRGEAMEQSLSILRDAPDISFAAGYLMDLTGQRADLVAVAGIDAGGAMAPQTLASSGPAAWPLDRAIQEQRAIELDDLSERFREHRIAPGAVQAERAILYPLRDEAQGTVIALLVLGVNPRLILDDDYRAFLRFVGETIAARASEADHRDSEERKAFLLELSDALRAEPDERSAKERTVELLAEHLQLDRCYISEVFEQQGYSKVGPERVRPGLLPMAGVYRLSDYPEIMRRLATQPVVIEDADNDARFSDTQKAMLAKVPQRALLVAPLRKGPREVVWALGAAMATPRRWTEGERMLLEDVAERTWAAVERARGEAALRASEEKYRSIIERMGDAHCVLDREFRIESVNAATERLLGMSRTELVGRSHWDMFPASADGPVGHTFRRVVTEGLEQHLTHHYTGEGYDFHIELDAYPTDDGGVAIFWRDVTERVRAEEELRASERQLRAAVEEREALLKELHHRVKNNLQVVTSLLEMQARQANNPSAVSPLVEARNRVGAIGTIHELLYQSGSFSQVDLLAYARRLVAHVVSLYEKTPTIEVSVLGDEEMVDLPRAVPLGLLLNELVSNACKHAFPANTIGRLEVSVHREDGRMRLRVADTGIGVPSGFTPRESKTLGLQLVHMLAKQLGGTVEFHARAGTTVDVHVPR